MIKSEMKRNKISIASASFHHIQKLIQKEFYIVPNVKPETVNLLEKNHEKKNCYIGLSKDFLDRIPTAKAQSIKEKLDTLDLVQMKKFFKH